jgi:hypothetical protein
VKALHGHLVEAETLSWRDADGDVHQQTTEKVEFQSEAARKVKVATIK